MARHAYYGGDPWQQVSFDDVVLVPSVLEGMPLVALEAMQRGLRLVVTPIAPFREACPKEVVAEGMEDGALAAKVREVALLEHGALVKLYRERLERFSQLAFVRNFAALLPPELNAQTWARAEGWAE